MRGAESYGMRARGIREAWRQQKRPNGSSFTHTTLGHSVSGYGRQDDAKQS